MAVEIKFLIDGLDRGQPLNPESFGLTINEDSTIGARVVSFDNELIFGGDVYSYIYAKLQQSGYCELIDCTVQYLCQSGSWLNLVDGYIIATESIFLLDRCQVKTKVYDETFSTKINNNKSIPFSMRLTTSKNGTPITPPTQRSIFMFNPADGTIDGAAYGYAVYDVFDHLVNCMSDGLVDFASNFFAYGTSGETPIYTNGLSVRSYQNIEVFATFETIYQAMRNKLNLGMGFEKQANGRPLLRIEPIAYFQQGNAVVNLYDQPDIEMRFDTQRLYASVNMGSNPFLQASACDSGQTPCTFVQTPFRAFQDETFGFAGQCNTTNVLNIVSNDIIFDTNVLEDIIRFGNQSYDRDNIVVQADINLGIGGNITFTAIEYDIYGIGQTLYNGIYTNENVSTNWLNGYPSSLLSFFQPFDVVDTAILVRNPATNSNQIEVDNLPVTLFEFSAHYTFFQTIITNPNTIFVLDTYTVPYAGIYTASAGLIFEAFRDAGTPFPIDTVAWGRNARVYIRQLDADGVEIASTFEGVAQVDSTENLWVEALNRQFVCNVGDQLVVDYRIIRGSGEGFLTLQRLLDTAVAESPEGVFNSHTSYFIVEGTAFIPPDLDPVDIDEVQAYLYKFKRPLTMAEISAIADETSKPIKLGKQDDDLAVIDTYIKTINIESVMRKTAQFELRSNKLLP
jgi:hypothetical protein